MNGNNANSMLSEKAQSLVEWINAQKYVCPLPDAWNKFYKQLPQKEQNASGDWNPALPLILAAWESTDDHDKRQRLDLHISWADQRGGINAVDRYLRELAPDKWHKPYSAD